MMKKPFTLTSFKVGSHFVAVDQFAVLRRGITLFDLGTGFGQPLFMFAEQFQRPLTRMAAPVSQFAHLKPE